MKRILFVLIAIALPLFAADSPRTYVSFEGASPSTVTLGKSAEVELHFKVKEGFHVNSNQPKSELLIPTTLKLEPPTDLAAGSITYPPGKDLSFPFDPSEKLNVYSDDFTVTAKMSATKTASPGNFTVHGQLRYQACSDNACYPPKSVPVQFDLQVVNHAKRAHDTTPQNPHIK
ncbi:MAG: disulfide bond formation protein DsbC [Acidobacteria bacterium]|nr:MAG: disulfide bond formation protein DsbC [Acidobacteriota bacterium]